MDKQYWLKRWEAQQIGFNLAKPHPYLCQFTEKIFTEKDSVLIPLCGKAACIGFLAQQAHQVTGVELSEVAIKEYFAEQDLHVEVENIHGTQGLKRYYSVNISLLCGDFFKLPLGKDNYTAFYDRAGLVALPKKLRTCYAKKLAEIMPSKSEGLLITLEYQGNGDLPPFSVGIKEVNRIYQQYFMVEYLANQEVTNTPSGEGIEYAFKLTRL